MARPHKHHTELRDDPIWVYLNTAEKRKLKLIASMNGLDMSAMVRYWVSKEIIAAEDTILKPD